mmetsp:Transcript_164794/g.400579  ORF Transcript_164794/g.400579 Transcript_164794/m.400579 type:complete len:203 (+) Transcript_164794:315-923(+)
MEVGKHREELCRRRPGRWGGAACAARRRGRGRGARRGDGRTAAAGSGSARHRAKLCQGRHRKACALHALRLERARLRPPAIVTVRPLSVCAAGVGAWAVGGLVLFIEVRHGLSAPGPQRPEQRLAGGGGRLRPPQGRQAGQVPQGGALGLGRRGIEPWRRGEQPRGGPVRGRGEGEGGGAGERPADWVAKDARQLGPVSWLS